MVPLLSFIAFTAAVALVAWWYTRGSGLDTSDGYFLGGRSFPWPVIAGSLMLTNLSTEHLVGMNGSAYTDGILVASFETLAALAAVALALFFLPRYLKSGLTTLPQYLERRFDKTTRSIVAGMFLLWMIVALFPVVLYPGVIAMEGLFDVPSDLGSSEHVSMSLLI